MLNYNKKWIQKYHFIYFLDFANKKYYPYLPLWPCRKILADQLSGSGPFDNYVTPEECL